MVGDLIEIQSGSNDEKKEIEICPRAVRHRILRDFSFLLQRSRHEVKHISDPDFQISPNNSAEEARRLIVGDWEWYKTIMLDRSGSFTNTPQTVGYKRSISFFSNGIAKLYRSDSLEYEAPFRIESTLYSAGYLRLVIGQINHNDFRVNERYLSYDERPSDGAAEFYVRRR